MFRDKNFNMAVIFSSAWHLFWISAVGIVVTPTVQTSNIYQEVGFLGPILEKTAFDLMVEEVTPQAETLYSRSTLFMDKVYLKPLGPRRRVLRKSVFSLRAYAKDTKEIPRYIDEAIRATYTSTKSGSGRAPASLEGPAREREIVFKPKRLTVLRGLYDDCPEYRVRLKFFVSSDGIVYNPKLLVSSGYPEVDLVAIRFLKRWRFSPLSFVEKDKSPPWGILAVKVLAK